jgi:hypothetical protein
LFTRRPKRSKNTPAVPAVDNVTARQPASRR